MDYLTGINAGIILLNIYYIGVTMALLFHDILRLRVVMICALSCLLSYGIVIIINIIQVIRLFLERCPVKIGPEIVDIY